MAYIMKLTPIKTNMTEVELPNGSIVLFSYKTPVACHHYNGKTYRTAKFWSKTTSRHINQWLDGREAEEIGQDFLDNLV